ncbi:phospholipase D-like domain-containing protein [Actinocatenispora rupis]|uniref:phospholipase D n=1 Tax=Actinocatenispora rupis TaxID=519421 RepID=A0A8J3N8W5_9ACTN|nr:phospholipase D-like domain-containing protein [Actinocatenispora rupis]GID10521.1 hypothetical protein Aru02nite_14100 [Actinocatenispora rupis]
MKVLARYLAALAVAASVLVGTAPAHAAVTTQAIFNDPTGTAAQQAAIVTKIVELIDGAPAGSRIRMSMFYADDSTIPDALVAAKNRGVNVQVVFSYKETGEALWPGLTAALGTDRTKASYAITCPAARGCVGNRQLSSVESINHNKFFLFSATGGTSNVVVQSSANLHNGRDGTKGWNNALVLTGNDGIYAAYSGYFDDLVAMVTNNNYYVTGRAPVTSGDAKVHFFPRQEASGANVYRDPTTDTVETVLDHVDCFGNTKVGTSDNHRTIIRVNTNIFSRPYLAAKLVALDAAGCYVEVVENYASGDTGLAHESLSDLLAKTSSAYNGVVVRYYCDTDPVWTHSKYLEVEGKYYGGADREILWTGSANLSTNSLRQSDETILQIEDPTVFAAYRDNFRAARDGAAHQPANGAAITC